MVIYLYNFLKSQNIFLSLKAISVFFSWYEYNFVVLTTFKYGKGKIQNKVLYLSEEIGS